jgi:antirestriction protein ArdC
MNDLYQNVTDRIVVAAEADTLLWVKSWSVAGDLSPMNTAMRRPYRGVNYLLLGLEVEPRGYSASH